MHIHFLIPKKKKDCVAILCFGTDEWTKLTAKANGNTRNK